MDTKGFTDRPITEIDGDKFGVQEYVKSLKDFIMQCDTPMTLAIQGDWGCGKTSFMKMIQTEIENDNKKINELELHDTKSGGEQMNLSAGKIKAKCLWFDTWQYSQFELQSYLSISLLKYFLEKIGDNDNKIINKIAKGIFTLAKGVAVAVTERYLGDDAADSVKNIGAKNFSPIELTKEVSELRNQVEAAIDLHLKNNSLDRIIFFIDDLDRLQPEKAVELLEVLKLFMDFENCVFVLAVDYNVVTSGISKKYGQAIGVQKGKSFFDKIIQLPFTVPVYQYNITEFIKGSLKKNGIDEKYAEKIERLIYASIGNNPRSIKRLFNSFELLSRVNQNFKTDNDDNNSNVILYGLITMEMAFEPLYQLMIQMIEDEDQLLELLESEIKEETFRNNKELLKDIPDKLVFLQNVNKFREAFMKLIDLNDNEKFDADELGALSDWLRLSSIVSSSQKDGQRYTKNYFSNQEEHKSALQNKRNVSDITFEIANQVFLISGETFPSESYKFDRKYTLSYVSLGITDPKGKFRRFSFIHYQKNNILISLNNPFDEQTILASGLKVHKRNLHGKYVQFFVALNDKDKLASDTFKSMLKQSYDNSNSD